MTEERFKQIIAALADKEVLQSPCARCKSSQIKKREGKFSILGESTVLLLHPAQGQGAQEIPCVQICCNQCGFLFEHAQVPLGLSTAAEAEGG